MATESVKILIEAEDKATAQLQKTVREQEKVAAKTALIKQQQEQALTAERIALEQGAEAAEAYRLKIQGLDADTAKLIAREKALIQEQKAANAELAKQPGGLKSTKATTEFFGAVAGMAGGSQVASVAGQLAGLTEKTGQFSEVAKAGGTSAMLFKAGLVAAAAAIGVQVGKAIGDVVFQTEKFNKELEKAIARSNELAAAGMSARQNAFAEWKIDEIDLNPAGADAAAQEKLDQVMADITARQQQKQEVEKTIKELEKAAEIEWSKVFSLTGTVDQFKEVGQYATSFTGESKAWLAEKQRLFEEDKKSLEELEKQKTELENILGIEKERAEKRREIAAEQASKSFISGLEDQLQALRAELNGTKNEYEAFKNTFSATDGTTAQFLLEDIEAAKNHLAFKQKEEQLKEQAAEKEKQRLKQVDDLRKSEVDRLKEQAILLAEGKEAAHAFRLEKQGMSEADAKAIAAQQAEIDRLNEQKSQSGKAQSLQAVESRLLTRGPEQDPTAKNTAEIAKLAKQQLEKLNMIASKAEKPPEKQQQLEVIKR